MREPSNINREYNKAITLVVPKKAIASWSQVGLNINTDINVHKANIYKKISVYLIIFLKFEVLTISVSRKIPDGVFKYKTPEIPLSMFLVFNKMKLFYEYRR